MNQNAATSMRPPQVVNLTGLQRAVPPLSNLQNVTWNTESIQTTPTLKERLQSLILPNCIFQMLHMEETINDKVKFDDLVNEKKEEARRMDVPPWKEDALMFVLGSEEILQYKNRKIDLGMLRHTLHISHSPPAHVLLVENQELGTKMQVEDALGRHQKVEDSVHLAVTNGEYVMELSYAEQPKLIVEKEETRVALVTDNLYKRRLNCNLQSTRFLTFPEISYLERKLKKSFPRLTLLEFENIDDCKRASWALDTLYVMFHKGMIDPKEPADEVLIHIGCDARLDVPVGVELTILEEEAREKTEKVMRKHRLTMQKNRENGRTFLIKNFAYEHWHYDDKKWFIEKVCERNNINIESISRIETPIFKPHKSGSRNGKIFYKIQAKLIEMAEYTEPPIVEITGDAIQEENLPWDVKQIARQSNFCVRFKTPEIGVKIIEALLYTEEQPTKNQFLQEENVELTLVYRRSFQISRRIRSACEAEIREFDEKLRKQFVEASEAGRESMMKREAYYYHLRVFEYWEDGCDTGIIGVEGWSPEHVKETFTNLEKKLVPTKFRRNLSPELFFGIGEAFVYSLQEKYKGEIVIDIDKYKGEIYLFGDKAARAYRDLQEYGSNKKQWAVNVEIPIDSLFLNAADLLDQEVVKAMEDALGARICFDDRQETIDFDGTVETFEVFTKALGVISQEVFKRQVDSEAGQFNKFNNQCPGCREKKHDLKDSKDPRKPKTRQSDYFRLHCGHFFCRSCANLEIETAMRFGIFKVNCRGDGCSAFWKPSELMTILRGDSRRMEELDVSKLQPLASMIRSAIIRDNVETNSCVSDGCPGIRIRSGKHDETVRSCGVCGLKYCGDCLWADHPGTECQ